MKWPDLACSTLKLNWLSLLVTLTLSGLFYYILPKRRMTEMLITGATSSLTIWTKKTWNFSLGHEGLGCIVSSLCLLLQVCKLLMSRAMWGHDPTIYTVRLASFICTIMILLILCHNLAPGLCTLPAVWVGEDKSSVIADINGVFTAYQYCKILSSLL